MVCRAKRDIEGEEHEVGTNEKFIKDSLLLQVVLTRTASLAARERAFVVAFASVDPCMASEVATGSEGAFTSRTDVFLLAVR